MMYLLSNRFLDFLTAKIGQTPIPIWVALTAVAAMVIIIAIIIGVSTGKNKKKVKQSNASEQQAVKAETIEDSSEEKMEEFAFETVEEDYLDPSQVADKPQQVAKEEPFIAMPKEVEEKALIEEKQEKTDTIEEDNSLAKEEEKVVVVEETVKPIVKPLVKANEDTQKVENKPVELPAYSLDTKETKTIAKPIAKPIVKKVEEEQPVAKVEEPKQEVVKEEIKPIAQPIAKPVAKPIAKAEPKKVEEVKPVAKVATKVAPKKVEDSKPVAKAAAKVEPKKIEEEKPVAKVTPKVEPKKVEEEKPVIKPLEEDKEGTFGKYVITENASNPIRPFVFTLVANNGQLLFESEPFKVKPRETSIVAFKKHVKEGIFTIDEDKQGNFRYKLYSAKNVLIGVGETYKTRFSCESSIESVKRFSESATVIEDKTNK